MIYLRSSTACLVVFIVLAACPASAISIREYRRFTKEQQAVFVSGAVSAYAYYLGVYGEQAKSKCIMDWYLGKPGEETPGPRQLAIEIAIAERRDPDAYHVEGIVLATIERACSGDSPKPGHQ